MDTIEDARRAIDAWEEGAPIDGVRDAVEFVLRELTAGRSRAAEPAPDVENAGAAAAAANSDVPAGASAPSPVTVPSTVTPSSPGIVRAPAASPWRVNAWVKKAILLAFRLRPLAPLAAGDLHFFDKIALQPDLGARGVRVVPGAIVREGAHVAPRTILMPCFVNIGAFIDEETMIDTWATVGSCAQVGRRCHISGGAGIGGVLEPLQAAPVIIEDDCFVGARAEVAEGVRLGAGAVLAMGCYVGASTKVFDATTGRTFAAIDGIPTRAVVVPGSLPSRDGSHTTYALILKKYRDEKTDARTALTEALR